MKLGVFFNTPLSESHMGIVEDAIREIPTYALMLISISLFWLMVKHMEICYTIDEALIWLHWKFDYASSLYL
jgi:hypothetical protein